MPVGLIPLLTTLLGAWWAHHRTKKLSEDLMDLKPGVLTSEFWMTVGTIAATFLSRHGIDVQGAEIAALLTALYTTARAAVKFAAHFRKAAPAPAAKAA